MPLLRSRFQSRSRRDLCVEHLTSRIAPAFGLPHGVSLVPDGTATGSGTSKISPRTLSDDGHYQVFTSSASNLTAISDTNGGDDVFVRDLWTGTTSLVSINASGTAAGAPGTSYTPSISGDGRYVVFASECPNLVAPATTYRQVYRRDLWINITQLVSVTPTGQSGDLDTSVDPTISANGRFVAFSSYAANLVTGVADTPNSPDSFVRDMATGTTRMISVTPDGSTAGNGSSGFSLLSADGSTVTFYSYATNLVAGVRDNNGGEDLFQRNLSTNVTTLLSSAFSGPSTAEANSYVGERCFSADGRYLVFWSNASTLVHDQGFTPAFSNIFVRDLVGGSISLVSVNSAGTGGGSYYSASPAISGNGRYVVFESQANDLVAGFGGNQQIYRRDLQAGITEPVSVNSSGSGGGNFPSYAPTISADGRFVCFESIATNLVAGVADPNGDRDVFVRDMVTGITVCATLAVGGTATGNGIASRSSIATSGDAVVFLDSATDLVSGLSDTNTAPDVFVWKRATGTVSLVSVNSGGTGAADAGSDMPVLTPDGRYVAYSSTATNLTPATLVNRQIYRRDTLLGNTALVSVNSSGTGGANHNSIWPSMSADGQVIAFSSAAWDLTADDTNGSGQDVYVRSFATGTTVLASHGFAGGSGNSHSSYDTGPHVSPYGNVVVFESWATNLAAGMTDTNGDLDAFAFDRGTGVVSLLSVNSANTGTGDAFSGSVYVSADGTRAAFDAGASNLVAGFADVNPGWDVVVRDLSAGVSQFVSRRASGVFTACFQCYSGWGLSVSANGNRVAFVCLGYDLVPKANRGFAQVYVRDVAAGTTMMASSNSAGVAGFYSASGPAISADGSKVAFYSEDELVPFPTNNNRSDVFLKNLATGAVALVSINAANNDYSNGGAATPAISADGAWVAFESGSTNLTTVTEGVQVFVRNMVTQSTYLLSRNSLDPGNHASLFPVISANGTAVGFHGFATDIVTGVVDSNGQRDVFANFRDPLTVLAVDPVTPDPRNAPVASIQFTLNRRANPASLDFSDVTLTRNGGANLLTNAATIVYVGGTTYRIDNLNGFTGLAGNYLLTVDASGMFDLGNNPGSGTAADAWTMDTTTPTVVVVGPVSPDPRNVAVGFVDVQFSEPLNLATFDWQDLVLTRNAGSNLIDASVTVTYVGGSTYRINNLAPKTSLEGEYLLTVNAAGVSDLAGNVGTAIASDAWTMDLTAPRIVGVYFDSTAWTATFRSAAGNANWGFPAQTGGGQLTTMPWNNVDTVWIRFDEPVNMQLDSLAIRGLDVPIYTPGSLIYDVANRIGRWTLPGPIATDRLILDLDGDGAIAARDYAGNKLAGTWTEGVSAFPTSGPTGVDFQFRFVIAVGDADRNGLVRNADLNSVRGNLFIDAGAGGYDIFADVDGNGLVRNADLNSVRGHLFIDPPTGPGPNGPRRGEEFAKREVKLRDYGIRRLRWTQAGAQKSQNAADLDAFYSSWPH